MPALRLAIATLLAITPALAAAQPVIVTVGPEIRHHLTEASEGGDLGLDPTTTDPDTVGGLFATVAYPFGPDIALGIHTGVARRHYATRGVGLGLEEHWDYRRTIVDVAVTAQFTARRLWAAPWLGRHLSRRDTVLDYCVRDSRTAPEVCHHSRTVEWTDDSTSVGVSLGVDLVRLGAHNLAAFVDVQTAFGAKHGAGPYSAVSGGVAYRLDFAQMRNDGAATARGPR
jgi:hypothetical protein